MYTIVSIPYRHLRPLTYFADSLRQPHRITQRNSPSSVADMPPLQDLLIELRFKIYALAIGSQNAAKITVHSGCSTPNDSPTDVAVIAHGHGSVTPSAANNGNSIVRVSKQIRAEALPILYQSCKFEFESSRALELFLGQIGDMKQHLRNVGISMGGYEHDAGALFGATKRSFAMLATVTGLQTFGVSHFDFCCPGYSPNRVASLDNFASVCSQFMRALHDSRTAKGLRTGPQMLDIIQLVVPDCDGCFACDILRPLQGFPKRGMRGGQSSPKRRVCVGNTNRRRKCRCKCGDAEHINGELLKRIKRRVASNLGWE
jgi:hypothetical protein